MMRLREEEWETLRRRMAAAKFGAIDARGEQELRFLISKVDARAVRMGFQELYDLGLFLVGLRRFHRLVHGLDEAEATA